MTGGVVRLHPEIVRRQVKDFSERGTAEERAAHNLEIYREWTDSRKRANAEALRRGAG